MIWRDNLKIGIEKIDQQHQELFKRFNEFMKIVRQNDYSQAEKEDKIIKTINFLNEYVVVHFNSEEVIQRNHNYPGYKEHHQAHEDFKADVADFKQEFENKEYDEDSLQRFSGKVLTWLLNHVADEDQKIANYIGRKVNE
jgi:hemerythrin